MFSHAMLMTVLTHPFQVLLMGMIVLRGVQGAVAAGRKVWRARHLPSGSHATPVAGRSQLKAA